MRPEDPRDLETRVRALRCELAGDRVILAGIRVLLALERRAHFDPAQPRDDHGRWAEIGRSTTARITDPNAAADPAPKDERIRVTGPFEWGGVDLRSEEGYKGAHTILRHVGKSDEELAAMILTDRRPSAGRFPSNGIRVGTFVSIGEANRLVNEALLSDPDKVEAVRSGLLPSATVKLSFPVVTGREAIQFTWNGDIYARNVNGVKIVINHDDLLLNGFSVHTAYPCHVEWDVKMIEVPGYFSDATDGFYQFAIEDDDRSIEFMVAMGVQMVRQSQCADLLAYIDDLLGVTDDTVLQNTWWASGAAYGFDDPKDTRAILRLMRERVAERVATGGGGMPE